MENIIHYLKTNNVEIIGFDFSKNDDIEIQTKEHGILSSQLLPEIELLTMKQLKELKSQFPIQVTDVQQLVVDGAIEAKEKFNKKINKFIKNIVNIKQSDVDVTQNEKIATLLDGIENKELKNEIITILDEKHSVFKDTHRQLLDAIKSSYIDSLTNCFNGNFYQKFLGKGYDLFNRVSDIEEYNTKLEMYNDINANAVMFFDMNNFKAINDLVGHEEGDQILKKFADSINNFDENIVLIRAGGDEFVAIANEEVLLNLESHLNSEEFIEKLNSHIPKTVLFCDKPLQSTVSKGLSKLDFPKEVYNKDDVMFFKKEFNRAYTSAEAKSGIDKKRIKEERGVSDYRAEKPDVYSDEMDKCLAKVEEREVSEKPSADSTQNLK